MSLSNLLSIAQSALYVHQRAVDVTGHNIANASTPGYTRQRLRLQAAAPILTQWGLRGRGISISGFDRPRSALLSATYRNESGALAQFSVLRDTLGHVESIFGEPSDTGLASTLDQFFNAFSDLANEPSSPAARAVVRGTARQLALQLNAIAGRVAEVRSQSNLQFEDSVDEINAIVRQLADVNQQIAAAGDDAPDLEDARDVLLDRLGALAPVHVAQREGGTVRVMVGDVMLVDGTSSRTVERRLSSDGSVSIGVSGESTRLNMRTGRAAAQIDLLNNVLPQLQQQLDDLTAALVTEVNALHRTGATLSGVPAGDFFDPNNVTAATIALSAAVDLSSDAIAAGSGSGAGDGSVAMGIAGLRDGAIGSLGNQSIGAFYRSIVTALGQEVRQAQSFATAQETLVANVETQRLSESGVSLDEEMVNLIVHQQAYTAATRLVGVADEMIQEVLSLI